VWFAVSALPGLLAVWMLFRGFTLKPPDTALDLGTALAGNSVNLRTWWFLEHRPEADIHGTLAPALLPTAFLGVTLVCGLIRRRAWPWTLAGLVTLVLALGINAENASVLAWWAQAAAGLPGARVGGALGRAILRFNEMWVHLPLMAGIRFPRRWLVVSALCLSIGGASGLVGVVAWIFRRWRWDGTLAGVLGGVGVATAVLGSQVYRDTLPLVTLPDLAFTAWIATEAPKGAVIVFPTVRPAPDQRVRASVPVFGNLSTALASADNEYFQLLHRRPTQSWPTLLTLRTRGALPVEVRGLLQDTNDLTDPFYKGTPPPGSAVDDLNAAARKTGRDWLVAQGFCCVVFDLGVYPEPWRARALSFYEPFSDIRTFEEGEGVLVGALAR